MNLTEVNFSIYFKDRRICEKCWLESRYYRYYWRFVDYSFCHLHGCKLFYVDGISYEDEYEPKKISIRKKRCFSIDWLLHPVENLVPFCHERELNYYQLRRITIHISLEVSAWGVVFKILSRYLDVPSIINFRYLPKWNQELNAKASEARYEIVLNDYKYMFRNSFEVVDVLAIIVFSFKGVFFERNERFKFWLLSRAYSYSPFFYACLNGGELIENGSSFSIPPVNFNRLSSFEIIDFIKYSPILSINEKKDFFSSLSDVSSVCQWDESNSEFGCYIKLAKQFVDSDEWVRFCLDGNDEISESPNEFIV
jgi:hypothetical protein